MTRVCPDCNREIAPELTDFDGISEIIEGSEEAEQGFEPVVADCTATVTLACSCEHVKIELAPASLKAWDVPDPWKREVKGVGE